MQTAYITVLVYAPFDSIRDTLDYDFAREKAFSYLDYYTGSGVTTKNDIAASTVNTDLSGSYANGRHLMVVQVKDIFGNTAYASKFFAVGNSVGGDSANITFKFNNSSFIKQVYTEPQSPQMTIPEKGLLHS